MTMTAHQPVVVQGGRLRAAVLPECGGKILSMKDDGHEILWQDTDRSWRNRCYGDLCESASLTLSHGQGGRSNVA